MSSDPCNYVRTMANANQAPLPRLSKRRWYVLRLLISSTWLYLYLYLLPLQHDNAITITRRSFPRGNASRGKDGRVIGPRHCVCIVSINTYSCVTCRKPITYESTSNTTTTMTSTETDRQTDRQTDLPTSRNHGNLS